MKEDRVRLPGVRAPQQDDVRLFNLAVRTCAAARSENRRQTGDAGGVSSPVAAIYVVRPHHGTNKFLGHVIQLVGGLRATEHAEVPRVFLRDRPAESLRHTIQCFIPGGGAMPAVLAHQWLSQTALDWGCHRFSKTVSSVGRRRVKWPGVSLVQDIPTPIGLGK